MRTKSTYPIKDKMLKIRIDNLGFQMLSELADDNYMSRSEYLRAIIFGEYKKMKARKSDIFIL